MDIGFAIYKLRWDKLGRGSDPPWRKFVQFLDLIKPHVGIQDVEQTLNASPLRQAMTKPMVVETNPHIATFLLRASFLGN